MKGRVKSHNKWFLVFFLLLLYEKEDKLDWLFLNYLGKI